MFFIHKEQNHMVAGGDHRVVVGDDHLFIANDRADGSTRWQADIADRLANHLARLRVAVGNRLDGFRRAST
jgi:hypothetical protein